MQFTLRYKIYKEDMNEKNSDINNDVVWVGFNVVERIPPG
jgi:hypothetical protein